MNKFLINGMAVLILFLGSCDNAVFAPPTVGTDPIYIKKMVFELNNPAFEDVTLWLVGDPQAIRKNNGDDFLPSASWAGNPANLNPANNPFNVTLDEEGNGLINFSPPYYKILPADISKIFKFTEGDSWSFEVGPNTSGGGNFTPSDITGLLFDGDEYIIKVKGIETSGPKVKGNLEASKN